MNWETQPLHIIGVVCGKQRIVCLLRKIATVWRVEYGMSKTDVSVSLFSG